MEIIFLVTPLIPDNKEIFPATSIVRPNTMRTRYNYLLSCALLLVASKASSAEDGIRVLSEKGVLTNYLYWAQSSTQTSNLMSRCEGKVIEEFYNAKSLEGFSHYLRFESSLAEEEIVKCVLIKTRTPHQYDSEKPLPFSHLSVGTEGDCLLLRDALRTRLKPCIRYYRDEGHFERLLVVEPRRDGRGVFHLLSGRHYE